MNNDRGETQLVTWVFARLLLVSWPCTALGGAVVLILSRCSYFSEKQY